MAPNEGGSQESHPRALRSDEEITKRIVEIREEYAQETATDPTTLNSIQVVISCKRTLEIALQECDEMQQTKSKRLKTSVLGLKRELTKKVEEYEGRLRDLNSDPHQLSQQNILTNQNLVACVDRLANQVSMISAGANNADQTANLARMNLTIQNLQNSFEDFSQGSLMHSTRTQKPIPKALSLFSLERTERQKTQNPFMKKISPVRFNGDYVKYLEFAAFVRENVDGDLSLSESDKFRLLKELLDTPASGEIKGIAGTNEFKTAAQKLMDRYAKPKAIQLAVEKSLERYCRRKASSANDMLTLRGLLTEAQECFVALECDQSDIKQIRKIGVQALETDTLKQFHQGYDDTLPNFLAFLLDEANARERLEYDLTPRQSSSVDSRPRRERPSMLATLAATNANDRARRALPCYLCEQSGHLASVCVNIVGDQAKKILEFKGVCIRCGKKHSGVCYAPFFHLSCQEQHLPCLCPKLVQLSTPITPASDGSSTTIIATIVGSSIDDRDELVWLVTFQAKVDSIRPGFIRGMGDSGGGCSVITRAAVKMYGLVSRQAKRPRIVRDSSNRVLYISKEVADVQLVNAFQPKDSMAITCYIVDGMLPVLPMPSADLREAMNREGLQLSDGQQPHLSEINILIGAEMYYSFFPPHQTRLLKDKLYVIHSLMGDVLHGPWAEDSETSCVVCLAMPNDVSICICPDLRQIMGGEPNPEDQENELCAKFAAAIRYVPERKRYIAPLPWLGQLRASIPLERAQRQTQRLRASLRKRGQLNSYHAEISKYVKDGHAIKLSEVPNPAFFLPHFAVVREDKATTKVRVVFNGSAVGDKGVSLNDTLFKGNPIHADLLAIILRFRTETNVLIADMKQAFLQIEVEERDRKFLCFLWFDDPNDPWPEIYQMKVLPFGLTCSPFILGTVLEKLAEDHGMKWPQAQETLKTGLYMDDLVIPFDDVEEGVKILETLQELLDLGSFGLHKFASNDQNMRNYLNIEISEKQASCLGVRWDTAKDTISVAQPSTALTALSQPTRRQAIQWMASVFDPLGIVLPWKIKHRALAREIASEGIHWDNPISAEAWKRLKKFILESHDLPNIQVPRYVDLTSLKRAFSDASALAVGGCVYGGNQLLIAKGRLATKQSMPRLELDAACLTAELLGQIREKISMTIQDVSCFSDSLVTLGRINNHPNQYKTFEANRLVRLSRHTSKEQWAHIESKLNPADQLSRGKSLNKITSIWFEGPEPGIAAKTCDPHTVTLATFRLTVFPNKLSVLSLVQRRIASSPFLRQGLRIAQRVVEFLEKRFHYFSYVKRKRKIDNTVYEYSRLVIFKAVQASAFQGKNLKQVAREMEGYIPYLDQSGVLRAATRLQAGDLPRNFKAPIVLTGMPIVRSIVERKHRDNGHRNRRVLRMELREEFLLLKGVEICRQVCDHCTACNKRNQRRYIQPEAPLPNIRASIPVKAFSTTGVDYYGPVTQAKVKCYVLLFTCGSIRAVHLELVHRMSYNDCIQTFVRFTSFWGKPRIIYSDNAKTFKKVAHIIELTKAGQKYCEDNQIEWRFITPYSPWKAGFYERMVGVVKQVFAVHLKGRPKLSFEETRTAVIFVQGIVNSRPLFQDPETGKLITPNHFLTSQDLQLTPDLHSMDLIEDYLPEANRELIRIRRALWEQFRHNYMSALDKFRCTNSGRQPSIGDLVAISDPRLRWGEWLVGVVSKLLVGSDKYSRTVEVALLNGGKRVCSTRHLRYLEMPFRMLKPNQAGGEKCGELPTITNPTQR